MKFIITGICFCILFASCTRTYYVVRHAEKAETTDSVAKNMQNDLPLSEAGKVRAIVLRDILKKRNIEYIFSTNTSRTLSTAQPLSEMTGVPIQQYTHKDTLDRFIERLQRLRKGNVLIVCHSNTVDEIVNTLTGSIKVPGDLKESEYDNLFIIKLKRRFGKKVDFEKIKYGYPSNP